MSLNLNELKIEVTQHCLLGCVHCSSDASPSSQLEITEHDCARIVQGAADLGARKVTFSGGEPLLWGPLPEMVQTAKRLGLDVSLYTTGNAPHYSRLLEQLKRGGASALVFSVFGARPETHESITRKAGSFEQTHRAMSLAVDAGFRVEAHFVPLQTNLGELAEIGKMALELGLQRVSVLRFVPQGRGHLIGRQVLTPIQNVALRASIVSLRGQGLDVRVGSPYNILLLNEDPTCMAAQDRLIVGPDLRIYPCDAFKNIRAEEVAGSAELSDLHTNSLRDCWALSPYLNKVREHLAADFEEPCCSCSLLRKCLSGCLAQKVIRHQSLKKVSDPLCPAKTLKGSSHP